jgi:hypothetical protein
MALIAQSQLPEHVALICSFCLRQGNNVIDVHVACVGEHTHFVAGSALVQSSDQVREATHWTGIDACAHKHHAYVIWLIACEG